MLYEIVTYETYNITEKVTYHVKADCKENAIECAELGEMVDRVEVDSDMVNSRLVSVTEI